jgi:hypothetical protein
VIDPKTNIRSKPTHSPQPEPSVKASAAIALAESAVQAFLYIAGNKEK